MIIAVDTGGTKTLIGKFSDNGSLENHLRFRTPNNPSDYIEQCIVGIEELAGGNTPDCISIALPNYTGPGTISQFSNLPWKNFDVAYELGPHFPSSRILVAGDAKLGGLGEARALAKPVQRFLYTTISTGIGIGFILDGHMSEELQNSEAGHISLEYNGIMQEWEAFGSGKAIYKTYQKYGSEIESKATWNEIADRFSRGFLALTPILQPEVIVIGGSMGTHFKKYETALTSLIDENLPLIIPRPRFVEAQNPEQAVIYGCYHYAIDSIEN